MSINKNVNKNEKLRENIAVSLIKPIETHKDLYKSNNIFYINCKNNNFFISDILNDQINLYLNNLPNGIYTFKYQIYKEDILQPSFLFHQKDELKKFMIFHELSKYKYKVFGIKLEFIDPDANRYILVLTIEE